MALSVGELMDIRSLRHGLPKVLAGARNMDKTVRWLHTGDVGNISYYMRGGEVLLTAGANLGATAEDRRLFVQALSENGVAGLIIELRTALSEVPTDVIDECERLGLPLVSLDRQVAFVDVTHEVNSAIVNADVSYLTQRQELADEYNEAMLAGESVKQLLERLSNNVVNPVLLVDSSGAVVHCANRTEPEEELVQHWAELQRRGKLGCIAFTLPSGKSTWSDWQLIVLPIQSGLSEHDQIAVEQAALAVALTLNKQAVSGALPSREPDSFILQLLSEEITEVAAALQATNQGFDARYFVPIALASASGTAPGETSTVQDQWEQTVRRVRSDFHRRNSSLLLATARDGLAYGVIGVGHPDERLPAVDSFVSVAGKTAEPTPGLRVKVITGQEVRTWRTLGRGLRDISAVVPFALKVLDDKIYDLAAPDVRRLLWSLRQNDTVQDFVAARLGPVLRHDAQKSSKLLPTLVAYCEYGGRKVEAARALHIERPSLYDRLSRLENLLGVSFRDPNDMLGIHVAVLAYLGNESEKADRDD